MKRYRSDILYINIALVLTGVADLATTLYWLNAGLIVEANPVMAAVLNTDFHLFICVKLATLAGYVAVVQWYSRRNYRFAKLVSAFTLISYWLIYTLSFISVNRHTLLG